MPRRQVHLLAAAVLALAAAATADDFVPFVIPSKPDARSLIALSSRPIATDAPRVTVRDGHFALEAQRVRVWGVNLCFGACFPSHADAPDVAGRLAAGGVNSVRFHHMDNQALPNGIWDPKDNARLSDEALDRLDFFLDQLARRGIWANINLHVSRTHSRVLGLPDPGTGYDKMVDLFTPKLIDAQKQYARDLLGHVNKYRKLRYADDPAVAFVEITNEDSLFMWGAESTLPALPEYYAKILQGQYASWLAKRYGTTAKLREAWGAGASPLGPNVLADTAFELPQPKDNEDAAKKYWHLEQHEGCKAELKPLRGRNVIRLEIVKANATNWHLQFNQPGQKLSAGKYYTVAFRARADKPRPLAVGVSMAHDPWGNLGLSRAVKLTGQWKSFRFGFAATADDDNARLNFSFGGTDVSVELGDVELRPGGRTGLAESETLEAANVALWGAGETETRALDRMRFLAETEKAYFDGMYAFIRKDLGCKALITGTIVFGPLGLYGQSGMDYIDGHAYWHHPNFPGRPWDPANWTVQQEAMADHPDRATVVRLSAERLAGKPYTVSEYNHPAPNDYQAECVPLMAAWAAAQDWDGVWFFAYSHRSNDWNKGQFTSFFDIDANPAKWGFMPSGAIIFREGGMGSLEKGVVVPLATGGDVLADLARMYGAHDGDLFAPVAAKAKLTPKSLLSTRLHVTLGRTAPQAPPAPSDERGDLKWTVAEKRGTFVAGGIGGVIITPPHAGGDKGYGTTAPAQAVITLVPMDGQPLPETRKLLLTACGRCENTDMVFSADRRTVGRNWGKPPVRIEAVTGRTNLPRTGAGEPWKCVALGPDGRPAADVPVVIRDKDQVLEIGPKYKTMWYLLTREKSPQP